MIRVFCVIPYPDRTETTLIIPMKILGNALHDLRHAYIHEYRLYYYAIDSFSVAYRESRVLPHLSGVETLRKQGYRIEETPIVDLSTLPEILARKHE